MDSDSWAARLSSVSKRYQSAFQTRSGRKSKGGKNASKFSIFGCLLILGIIFNVCILGNCRCIYGV